ncbi:MAG TPA: CoA pyrophosphatase [Actinomycetota bacterium]|nr:CoA pyrophosphatase [Actinomycetota bacterium]
MYRSDVRTRLKGSLDPRPSPRAGPGDRLAAVLLPLVEDDRLVLTRRTEQLSRHPGEISFPGGLAHEEDVDLSATALRETQEELGLPPEEVDVLGALVPVHTFVSAILIVPFVGLVSGDPVFAPSEAEIAQVLAYPLDELTAAETTVEWPRDGHVYRGFAYPMRDGNTIWGATAAILHQLLEQLGSRP